MAKLSGRDTIVKYNQILNDLKNKIYKPVYLLMGEETYYIDKLSEFIANNVLSEAERSFNQSVIYGKDVADISIIADSARRFPMMANYQVIIVREAQEIKKIEGLAPYVKKPLGTTILVICYKGKTVDKRTSFVKDIAKVGEVLECAPHYENEIPNWIVTYTKQNGFEIDSSAAAILAEFLGSDLSKIVNELNKLFTVLPEDRKKILVEDIEKNIGISKEYNTFELSKAISYRQVLKANKIAAHFGKNHKEYPFAKTMGTLFLLFSKLLKYHDLKRKKSDNNTILATLGIPYTFLRDYEEAGRNFNLAQTTRVISLLREYDMKSKGFNYAEANESELLRELVSKIFN